MSEKPRGRPRSYDPGKALDAALETFWEGGFTATSLDELAAATGMNRPSLYAAFGDKKSIYLKSFGVFAESLRTALNDAMRAEIPLRRSLESFYEAAIDIYLSGPHGPRGCFIVCTAPAEAARDADIRAALHNVLKEIDAALTMIFSRAQAKGEIAKDADAATLAQIAAAVLHSIALRARAGETREGLHALAQQAARSLG